MIHFSGFLLMFMSFLLKALARRLRIGLHISLLAGTSLLNTPTVGNATLGVEFWGVNWDQRVTVRMCFVSADQTALPVAEDFGIQCGWHADSSRVLVYTFVHLPLDCYDSVNIWGNGDFEVYKCS